jgi:hypothetical protein
MTLRIGFIGLMRSGKDTSAEYIQSKKGGAILKFADPMYAIHDFAVSLLGLEGKQRRLLQLIGTEWGRECLGTDFWVDHLERTVASQKGNIYVTDCRFPNEAERLTKLGFFLVKVVRPREARLEAGASSEDHASERHIPAIEADVEIRNDGSLSDLHTKLDALLERLGEGK